MDELVKHSVMCWKQGKTLPYVLELRVSDDCNLNCTFCPGYDKEMYKEEPLSTEEWKNIIKQASKMGIKQCIFFSDLEPLMHKDALELMLEVKKRKLLGKTATNGTLLTKKICEELVKSGWDELYISLEGPDAETNDAIRGKGVFNLVRKNLLVLKEIKERLGSDKPKIMFHTVFTNKIYKKLDKMIILAHDLGINSVNFHPLSFWNDASKKLKLSDEQHKGALKHIIKAKTVSKKLGINTNVENFTKREWEKESIRNKKSGNSDKKKAGLPFLNIDCYLPWYFISVHRDGRVNPCHTIHNSEENIKNKRLKDIWNGLYFNSIRKKIEEKKFPDRCYTGCCVMQSANHLEFKEKLQKEFIKKSFLKIR